MLLSLAVTEGVGYKAGNKLGGMKLDFIGVRRAYFHAPARRDIFIHLPPEDAAPAMCGKINKAMYGTRDAAQNWEFAYADSLQALGFMKGKATQSAFYHQQRNIRLVVHGDDFTVLAMEADLGWFRRGISDIFDVKFRGRIGPSPHGQ